MRRLISAAAFAAVAGLTATAASAAQFVTNGDFTSLSNGLGELDANTVVTGWSGNGGYNFVTSQADLSIPGQYGGLSFWDAANGGATTWNGLAAGPGNFIAMDGAFQVAAVTQTITGLTPGDSYDLSFSYAFGQQYTFDGATTQSLTISLGGGSATFGPVGVADHGFDGWYSFSGLVTATSTSEVLSFLASGTPAVPPFAMVSSVSLTSVPEPAAWTMVIFGFGGLGALARRRRSVAVA